MNTAIEQAATPLERISRLLGQPPIDLPHCKIFHGDCVELLKSLPSESIDLTVTSPPYNIGKEYESKRALSEYLEWCQQWIAEIYRVTRPTGAFWLNLGYMPIPGKGKALPIPYLLWDRVPFFLIQEIVWNYAAGVAGRQFFSPRNEKFLWYVKNPEAYTFNLDEVRDPNVKYPNQKKNGKIKVNALGKNPSDVWQISKVTSGAGRASKERTDHPAQFPIALIERIVKACSNPGELVLDPFMGSGSTAHACLGLGRGSIGMELNPRYVEIARHRVGDFLRQEASLAAQGQLFIRE